MPPTSSSSGLVRFLIAALTLACVSFVSFAAGRQDASSISLPGARFSPARQPNEPDSKSWTADTNPNPTAALFGPAQASSDGAKVVFGSVRNGGNNDVFVMNFDGSNQTRLTTNAAYDDQPKWSPDNSKILFMSDRDGNFELYTMKPDGSAQTRLTNTLAAEGFAAWSPDGARIAFVSGDLRNVSTFEIYVMNADGSNRTRLTNDTLIDGVPAWSPDGNRIVFMSGDSSMFAPNSFEIYVMNSDGTNRTQLTSNTMRLCCWNTSGT